MMSPARIESALAVLQPRLEGMVKFMPQAAAKPAYQLTDAGIAVVPVMGTLVRRASAMSASCGMTSYHGLAEMASAAFADPMVKGVLLDIDSGGGEAGGLFDLVAELRGMASSTGKPLWAVADEAALSAAYGIACAADKIWVAQTAEVGSVGVVALHVDQSRADAEAGLSYTYVHGGARKVEGNPHEPLTDDARERLQADVDDLYEKFCLMVAAARGTSFGKIQKTEAGIYRGADAVEAGLADYVGTLQQAHDMLADKIRQESGMTEEEITKLKAEIEESATERMAEITSIAAQAKRLGVEIDAVGAVKSGISAADLRRQVLDQAAERDAAADIVSVVAQEAKPDRRLMDAVMKLRKGE